MMDFTNKLNKAYQALAVIYARVFKHLTLELSMLWAVGFGSRPRTSDKIIDNYTVINKVKKMYLMSTIQFNL
jgi:hypothetical protein